MKIDLSRLKLLDRIQPLITAIMPEFIEKNLKDPEIRKAIVLAVDTTLITQVPAARLIPSELRQRIIEKQLEIAIDDILLRQDEAFEQSVLSEPSSS
jgi:hypothetical protein